MKYRNHRSIPNKGEVCKNKSNKQPLFSYSEVTRDEILKEILSLDTTKAYQDTDVPMQIYFQTFYRYTFYRYTFQIYLHMKNKDVRQSHTSS